MKHGNLTVKDIEFAQYIINNVINIQSLNVNLANSESSDETYELAEIVADRNSETFEEHFEKSFNATVINDIMNKLNPREKQIIKMRFGFVDGEVKSLEEIGKSYGVSRERIRQIETRALQKLKYYITKNYKNFKEEV